MLFSTSEIISKKLTFKKKRVFSTASEDSFIHHSFNTKYKLYFITRPASFFKTVIFQLNFSVCSLSLPLQATPLHVQRPLCLVCLMLKLLS